jgi:hypothetical protein
MTDENDGLAEHEDGLLVGSAASGGLQLQTKAFDSVTVLFDKPRAQEGKVFKLGFERKLEET